MSQTDETRCDSCGASLRSDAAQCEYCGRPSQVHFRGSRLCVLVEMLIDADQYRVANEVAVEVLKEHPQNAPAWGVLGLTTIQTDLRAALKSFGVADQFGASDGFIKYLKGKAGLAILNMAFVEATHFLEAPDYERFKRAHRLGIAAERLFPDIEKQVSQLFSKLDSFAEEKFGMLFLENNYQNDRRRRP